MQRNILIPVAAGLLSAVLYLSAKWSILGALVFVLLNEGMRFIPQGILLPELIGHARLAVLGILIVLLMLFRPQGLVGRYKL